LVEGSLLRTRWSDERGVLGWILMAVLLDGDFGVVVCFVSSGW